MKWITEKKKKGTWQGLGPNHSFLLDGGISKSLQSIVRGGVYADGIIGEVQHTSRERGLSLT